MKFFSTRTTKKADSTILRRIADADKSAAQECVELYGKLVWALAKQYTNSIEEAEQMVPKIFTDIWESAADCSSADCEEAVWITLVARRRLNDCLLKEDLQPAIETTKIDFQPSPEIAKAVLPNPFGKIQKRMAIVQ